MKYQVNEIFTSVQGEGCFAGMPFTFIRLQGCPVGCPWCDSVRTWGPGAITDHYMRGWLIAQDDVCPDALRDVYTAYHLEVGSATAHIVEHTDNYDMQRGFVAGLLDRTPQIADTAELSIVGDKSVVDRAAEFLQKQGVDCVRAYTGTLRIVGDSVQLALDYYQPPYLRNMGWKINRNGKSMDVMEIVRQLDAPNVIITGGEPTLFNLDPLILALKNNDVRRVHLETAGLNALKGDLVPDWIVWSPKERLKFQCPDELLALVDEVKFVVDTELTEGIVNDVISHTGIIRDNQHPKYVFMPEGCPPSQDRIDDARIMAHDIALRWNVDTFLGMRLQYILGVR